MTSRITADEIITQKHIRYFIQPGGSSPSNVALYSGLNSTYLNIESVENPVSGGITPIRVHDPRRVGKYRNVARQVDPPDFPTATVTFMQKQGVLPRHLVNLSDCVSTFYQMAGDCKDLSDFINGWSAYIKIMSNGEVTNITEAGGSFDGDEGLMDELEFTFANVYNAGKLGFGETAATEVNGEVIDIVYGSRVQCGKCGPSDDGTQLIYAVVQAESASAGADPKVVYSLDGGLTWSITVITGATSSDDPVAIDIVGNYLVVVTQDGATGGYFYAELNALTGAPGTFSEVNTGFVTAKQPGDILVLSPNEVWFCGDGGYIYKSTDITAGVSVVNAGSATTSNLERIDGMDETLVAVGASGTVVYSINRGATWATTTTSPGAATLQALAVADNFNWWVGNASGAVYNTDDQGTSAWTQNTAAVPATAAAIQDIVLATDEVLYLAYTTAGPVGKLRATHDGGNRWYEAPSGRILAFPTLDRINRIAVPDVPNPNTAANNVALGGLAGNGTDGIILIGEAAVL